MRLVEGRDLAADEFRMIRQLVQQPRSVGRRPGHESGLEGVDDAGHGQHLGDLEVGVAAFLSLELVEELRGHDHHLDLVEGLRDLEVGPIPLGLERVARGAHRGRAANNRRLREGGAEAADDLAVEVEGEVEDVSRVRIEDEGDLDPGGLGAGDHPTDAVLEALPIGLAVAEGQKGRNAEPGLGGVIDESFLRRAGPDGFLPEGGGLQIGGGGDHGKRLANSGRRGENIFAAFSTKPMSIS